jgi:hypothetical protein
MVGVHGRHLLPEGYVVAPSSPVEPGPTLTLVLSVDGDARVVHRRCCLAVLGHQRRAWLHLGQLLPSV